MNRKKIGIFAALASSFLYGVNPVVIRTAYNAGASTNTVMLLRACIALPIYVVLFLLSRKNQRAFLPSRKETGKLLLLGGVGMTLCTVLLMGSYNYIPVGMATTLHFIYPILVNVSCVFLFHEPLSKTRVAALCLAMAGVALFTDGGGANAMGFAMALLSGGFYAFYMVYLPYSGLEDWNPFRLGFYMSLMSAVYGLIAGMVGQNLDFHLAGSTWLCIGAAALIEVFAVVLLQVGIRLAGVSMASILCTLEPITSVVLGFLVLQEEMNLWKILGCGCIIGGILLVTMNAGNRDKAAPE